MLEDTIVEKFNDYDVVIHETEEELRTKATTDLVQSFLSAKKIEGCSDKTLHYYQSTINMLFFSVKKAAQEITTNDIRCYLSEYQEKRKVGRMTIDNMRRILSSFSLG